MNISNFNYALMISALLISSSVNAQSWIKLGSSNNREVLYDGDSLNGGDEDKNIIVLFKNKIDNPSDAVQSEIFYYSLNCTDRSYIIKSRKRFKDINAKDFLDETIGKNQKRVTDIKPNTFPLKYFDAACKTKELQSAGAQSNGVNDLNKVSLQYFGKYDKEKNMFEVFFNNVNPELKGEISTGFIFANNLILILNDGGYQSKFLNAYSPVIPLMKTGVEKYYKKFDQMANSLGVSREMVLAGFDIKMEKSGYAGYIRNTQWNNSVRGAISSYLSFFSGDREEWYSVQRDINPYYKDKPPSVLYGAQLDANIKIIDDVFVKVFQSAKLIDEKLMAKEVKRIQDEKALAIRREEDAKKLAEANKVKEEENRRRQEFLNSPEGKRQIAAEQEAERQRQIQYSKKYPYYAVIACTNYGSLFPLHGCMKSDAGNESTLELRNGSSYNLYKMYDIMVKPPGQMRGDRSLQIDLERKFSLKMQNASNGMVLGVVIRSRDTDAVLFEKKVDRWGVIGIEN